MKKRMQRHAALERDLREALGRDEFVVFYQPQLELASGRLRGYEALVRWERPGEGILSPRDFLASRRRPASSARSAIGCCARPARMPQPGSIPGTVAVNFSAAQFRSQDIDKAIAKVLAETGLPAERLEIEVPESLFLEHAPDVMETLEAASRRSACASPWTISAPAIRASPRSRTSPSTRSRSTGASSPADRGCRCRARSSRAIVGLGRSLSVDVTAEGVETSEQVTLLKAAGCNIVQGFLFGVPSAIRCRRMPTAIAGRPRTRKAAAGSRLIRSICPGRVHRCLRQRVYPTCGASGRVGSSRGCERRPRDRDREKAARPAAATLVLSPCAFSSAVYALGQVALTPHAGARRLATADLWSQARQHGTRTVVEAALAGRTPRR